MGYHAGPLYFLMILRDEHGEVEVKIGDLFKLKSGENGSMVSATFSVICPVSIYSDRSPIWVRLIAGSVDVEGKRYEVRQDGNEALRYPVLVFTSDLVARLVRLMTFDIPAPVAGRMPAKPVAETRRAPASKKRAEKYQPTSESLF